jgi:hypothetical protein
MCIQDELERMMEADLKQAGIIGQAMDIIITRPKPRRAQRCQFCGKFIRFDGYCCFDADREDKMNELSYNQSR